MPRRLARGLLLRWAFVAAAAVVSVGEEGVVDNAEVLAEINELSESLDNLFDDEKKAEVRAFVGEAFGDFKTDSALEKEIGELGSTCTIKRLAADELLSTEFFNSTTVPVVFRSPEVDKWKAFTRPWTRAFLRDTYGRSHVMPRSMQVLSRLPPDRTDNGGTLVLRQFALLDSNRSILDRSWLTAQEFEEQDDLLLVDELWDDEEWDVPHFFRNHSSQRGLEMGPSGHGFPFHQQGDLWQAQVVGKKLWMLHPPTGLPADWEILDPRAVFRKALAREGCPKMLHCLLQPGDVMFVPRFWYHSTLNVGDTVALGGDRDVWDMASEELASLVAPERKAAEKNPLLLDMSAVDLAKQGKWQEALQDSKMAHLTRPADPYIGRRFSEMLLAKHKNTSAVKVTNRCVNKSMTLHEEGWMDDQELSGILTLLAHPLVANSFGMEVQRLPDKAQSLVKRAVKLDPNNWAARIMISHNYLMSGNLESAFKVLHSIPAKSMAAMAAANLLQEMCYDMPDEYKPLQKKYCPEPEEQGEEEGEAEGEAEEEAPAE